MLLVAIAAPHFYAGMVLRNDIVVEAAPILRWTIGKRRDELRDYFRERNWKVILADEGAEI